MKQRCEGCKFFDCGEQCKCKCHYGSTDKIRHDHGAEDLKPKQKKDSGSGNEVAEVSLAGDANEVAMEGLSALFG